MSATSTGSRWELLLRWSGRDLRSRWIQVAAIALVIALGTGSYAGLSSVTQWRRASTDHGYETLRMHDLRVRLAEGNAVQEGELRRIAQSLAGLSSAEERLIVEVQVDASDGTQTVLVPGLLYGVAVGDELPSVNAFSIPEGRWLDSGDQGKPVALLEHHFGKHYDLPAEGTLTITGGTRLTYVGQALTPEYFIVTTERGGFLAEANFAAVFTSLTTAQAVTGRTGEVNDLVLTLMEGADRAAAATELQALFDSELPGVGATITTREEDPSFRLIDADIDGDQQIYNIFALLMFSGAVVAAFNLIARVVESQRREIGLAMMLGVAPARIAVRPLLVAAEIALLGVALGVAVGALIGIAMASVLRDLQPLPQWQTPFLPGVFLAVAIAGFMVPFVATMWPVWRAVRVPPIQAVHAGYRSARGSGFARWVAWLRLPGNTFAQIPVRNVVRSPRRSFLTSIGIAAALAALIAFVGLIDSFLATIDRGRDEVLSSSPDRLEVTLERPVAIGGPEYSALATSAVTSRVAPVLRLAATAMSADEEVGLQVELLSLESDVWTPRLTEGVIDRESPGIYLTELAARSLGVGVGDEVRLRHPRLTADGAFELIETVMPVLGLHPHPFRFVAYMDINRADAFNLSGTTNLVQVVPRDGVAIDEVKRELFDAPAVVSVQGVDEVAQALDDLLGEFVTVLRVIEGVMLLLAALIAFNSASINMDERAREHATMFAFGVRVRTVLRMAVVESLILGVFATALGVLGGVGLLRLIIAIRIPTTLPDIEVLPVISPGTFAVSVALGVVVVALAPLFTWRRLRRMDVASTMKVIE